MEKKAFINLLMPHALQIQAKHKIPALFIIGQAAIESGWGKSSIGNNLFGIKAWKKWTGKKQLVTTTEILNTNTVKFPEVISITQLPTGKYKYIVKDWFRDYDSIEECLIDHASVLLLTRYKSAFNYTDPYKFADEVAKAGYATAIDYAGTLKAVIKTVEKSLK